MARLKAGIFGLSGRGMVASIYLAYTGEDD